MPSKSVYPYKHVEARWQRYWEENKVFHAKIDRKKEKFYCLDMFPYPSAAGLHVGHPVGYFATDIVCRYKRMRGFNVLHPMGWDAFGLPAEQYAVRTGVHPKKTTQANIDNFRAQLKCLGLSYDWSREFSTTDPEYMQWTQWMFLKIFEKGLAYQANVPVNWCEELKVVLANEEVPEYLEKGYKVVRKPMQQWMLRITQYAEELLKGLPGLDWPASTKRMQDHWIGERHGLEINFQLEARASKDSPSQQSQSLAIYTTRPETLYGVTFLALSADHPMIHALTIADCQEAVSTFTQQIRIKRSLKNAPPAGVPTGSFAIHPFTQERIPIWITDYVIGGHGAGAVMGVPAHDVRDYAFAQIARASYPDHPIAIKVVVQPDQATGPAAGSVNADGASSGNASSGNVSSDDVSSLDRMDTPACAFTEDGWVVRSGPLNGLKTADAAKTITTIIIEKKMGRRLKTYRMRDWVFSRQRYWGEPIPIAYKGDLPYPLPEEELPLLLPPVDNFLPSSTGESPLSRNHEWLNEKPGFTRETHTMPQWAGSCWYYLRFLDPQNLKEAVSKEAESYWMPVDLYVGGSEHAVLHLLYARFWNHVLHSLGIVSDPEPFKKLVHQGMVLGEVEFSAYRNKDGTIVSSKDVIETGDGGFIDEHGEAVFPFQLDEKDVTKTPNGFIHRESGAFVTSRAYKMSKSRGNVINPSDILKEHSADAVRLFLMFLGPLEQSKPWSTQGLEGMSRFIGKVWRFFMDSSDDSQPSSLHFRTTCIVEEDEKRHLPLKQLLHQTIRKVTDDIEAMSFNTAISQLMILFNEFSAQAKVPRSFIEVFIQVLSPFAPHLSEELWAQLGHNGGLSFVPWPIAEEKFLRKETFELPIQINGRVRARLSLKCGMTKEEAFECALAHPPLEKYLSGAPPKKIIWVQDRLLSIVKNDA